MKITIFLLLTILVSLKATNIAATDVKITDYGAIADTSFLSTRAIQNAIDSCSQHGGGNVIFPAGSFKTATLFLKNTVHIVFEPGALLYGSTNANDYGRIDDGPQTAMFAAINVKNISISGAGEIDGQALTNAQHAQKQSIFYIEQSKLITIEGLTLRNTATSLIEIVHSDDIRIHESKLFNHQTVASAGIFAVSSSDLSISDLLCDTYNDCFLYSCQSSYQAANIVLLNNIFSSFGHAICMEATNKTGIASIVISNCVLKPSVISHATRDTLLTTGIQISASGASLINGIAIFNVGINALYNPIVIETEAAANNREKPVNELTKAGIKDLSLDKIRIAKAKNTAVVICGQNNCKIRDVMVTNVAIQSNLSKDSLYNTKNSTPKPLGLRLENTDNLQTNKLFFKSMVADSNEVVYASNCNGLKIENSTFMGNNVGQHMIALHQNRNFVFRKNISSNKYQYMVMVEGANTDNIQITENKLSLMQMAVLCDSKLKNRIVESGNIE